MAKKTGSKRPDRRRKNFLAPVFNGDQIEGMNESRDYKDLLREIVSNPAFKYVAGGIAAALLTRMANNMADRYPELSHFLRENLENLEDRMGEFKTSMTGSTRH